MGEKDGEYIVHQGDQNWWDGSWTTLCGVKLARADRILFAKFFGYKLCATCETLAETKQAKGK